MSSLALYRLVSHLDEPKRILTLTLDELAVAVLSMMLLVVSNHKLLVGLLGLLLYAVLRALKQGRGPRFLLVLAYWYLPYGVSQMFVSNLPPSHARVWIA